MNATAHTDEPYDGEGLNQSPSPFSSDLTCNQDFNGRANRRRQRLKGLGAAADDSSRDRRTDDGTVEDEGLGWGAGSATAKGTTFQVPQAVAVVGGGGEDGEGGEEEGGGGGWPGRTLAKVRRMPAKTRHALWTFMKFIGPGFMIAVAYSMSPHIQLLLLSPLPPPPSIHSRTGWRWAGSHVKAPPLIRRLVLRLTCAAS